jgi:HD-like signal output (HDOD) protein
MNNAYEITNKIDKLRPIPPVANQIMEMTASDLAEVILVDPFITASLLRVCNSA